MPSRTDPTAYASSLVTELDEPKPSGDALLAALDSCPGQTIGPSLPTMKRRSVDQRRTELSAFCACGPHLLRSFHAGLRDPRPYLAEAPRLARRTDGSSVTPDNKAYASQDLRQRGQGVGGGKDRVMTIYPQSRPPGSKFDTLEPYATQTRLMIKVSCMATNPRSGAVPICRTLASQVSVAAA